jgi:predicted Zn finger-like uncharacterized protein
MEVRCERCRAQYVFADDQVTEQGLTVRCSNCGHLFKVKKKALVVTLPVSADEAAKEQPVSAADTARAAAVQAAAQAVMADAERREWTLRQPGGQTYGFRDMSTLHRWIVERKAHREDEMRRADEPWRRLGTIPELQSFFAVVEAAERANQAPTQPASQPTMLQYPAQVFPGPGAPPPPTRTEQAFPPGRAVPPPGQRTEAAFPAQKPPPPPASRTEVAFPAQRPPGTPPTPRATATDLFAPTPPPVPLEGEAPAPDDPFLKARSGTEEGFPPPPAPATAPARPTASAAWEERGGAKPAAPPAPAVAEPAWTRAQPAAPPVAPDFGASARRGGSSARWILVALLVAVAGAGGAWYLLGGGPAPAPAPAAPKAAAPTPAPPPVAAAPAPAPAAPTSAPAVAPAAPAPAPAAPAPAPVPAPEAAAQKPAEPPAAAKAEPPPVPRAEPPAAGPEPARAAEPPPAAKAEPPRPKGVKGSLSQARRLRDQGKTKQALDLYGQVLAQAPGNAEAHAGRGWCHLELSQYAQAEAAFQAALESDSSSADGLLGLAETFRYEGRRADAVRFYERYLVEHPDGEDAVAAQNAIKSLKE